MGLEKENLVCITIDGSTYYETPGMKEMVETQLEEIMGTNGPHGLRHFCCIKVENAPIVGAAIAGLTAFEETSKP
jgi:hexokinase